MTRVVVVGVEHQERGLATIAALHDILERIGPEVNFLEIPPDNFAAFKYGSRSNLESAAAMKYRQCRQVSLVPVDMATPDEQFFRNFQYLDRRLSRTSATYRSLVDQHSANVAAEGLEYLNGNRCSHAWLNIYVAMEAGIQKLSHEPELPGILQAWRDTSFAREAAMLTSIDAYLAHNAFELGVLLIGVAHVSAILERSRNMRDARPSTLSLAPLFDI